MSPPVLLLIGAFLLVAVAGPIYGLRQLDAASTEQVELGQGREHLEALLRAQLSEETELRGYVATRDRYFLDEDTPHANFEESADALAADVRRAGLADALPLVERIRSTHRRWQLEVQRPLLADPQRSNALAVQTLGKVTVDTLRSLTANLRERLSAAGDDVERRLRRSINTTVAASTGAITLFALVALALAFGRAGALTRLAREQSLVTKLQQTLRVGGTQLARTKIGYSYTSATREALVGGDLLDSWRTADARGWFLIADASGKGVEAARHSAFVQYAVRALAMEENDPSLVLERFNRLFLETFDDPGIFVVLFLGVFDARREELHYASAGHSTAFVRRPAGLEQLAPTGSIIGLDRGEHYETRTVPLRTGDLVVLATDGLTESRDADGAFLGDDGAARIIATGSLDPQTLCDALVAEVERRSNGAIGDDLAILAMRVTAVDDQLIQPFSTIPADDDERR